MDVCRIQWELFWFRAYGITYWVSVGQFGVIWLRINFMVSEYLCFCFPNSVFTKRFSFHEMDYSTKLPSRIQSPVRFNFCRNAGEGRCVTFTWRKVLFGGEGRKKNLDHFSICACHPCAGAMLIFSVSFQFYRMSPKRQALIVEFQYMRKHIWS